MPVIGIVAQGMEAAWKNVTRLSGYNSYIMTAYVKHFEAQGAQVVPILNGENENTIKEKMKNLNGIVFPGGGGDYLKTGKIILEEVKKYNDKGIYYPLWGTCLGLENLAIFTSDLGEKVLESFELFFTSIPLKLTGENSKIFEGLSLNELKTLESKNYLFNNHFFGISPARFETDQGLKNFWSVTSTHKLPSDGRDFVASIEAKDYPIYATMFHPEKAANIFYENDGINHSWENIQLMQHFSKQFMLMARQNPHSWSYKFPFVEGHEIVGLNGAFGDIYVFK